MLVSVRPQFLTLNEFIKGTSPSFSWQYILPLLDQISSRTALEKRDHILDNPVAQEHFVRKGQVHRLMYSGARTSVVLNEKSNVILAKSSAYELNLGTTHATNERTSKELLNCFRQLASNSSLTGGVSELAVPASRARNNEPVTRKMKANESTY
jgi:hypothetical protein